MGSKWFWPLAILLSGTLVARGQAPVKMVRVHTKLSEHEYYGVLAVEGASRQGPYVRYQVIQGPRNEIGILESGSYEAGLKTGEWRTFWPSGSPNRLESKGTYRAGLPDGLWTYYFQPKPGEPSWTIYAGKESDKEISFEVQDTLSVVQAKGQNRAGMKVGLWKYYDEQKKLVQAINEPNQRLMYDEELSKQPISSEELAKNHSVLYLGGKQALSKELQIAMNVSASAFHAPPISRVNLEIGKINVSEVRIVIDSLGKQTGVKLVVNPASTPSRYEQFVLDRLANLPGRWLPKTVNGEPKSAGYRVLVTTTRTGEYEWVYHTDMLGE